MIELNWEIEGELTPPSTKTWICSYQQIGYFLYECVINYDGKYIGELPPPDKIDPEFVKECLEANIHFNLFESYNKYLKKDFQLDELEKAKMWCSEMVNNELINFKKIFKEQYESL